MLAQYTYTYGNFEVECEKEITTPSTIQERFRQIVKDEYMLTGPNRISNIYKGIELHYAGHTIYFDYEGYDQCEDTELPDAMDLLEWELERLMII